MLYLGTKPIEILTTDFMPRRFDVDRFPLTFCSIINEVALYILASRDKISQISETPSNLNEKGLDV